MIRFALVALLLLAGCSQAPEPVPQPTPPPATVPPAPRPEPDPSSEELVIRELIDAHNKERESRGLGRLARNEKLMASAKVEAECCLRRGLDHNCTGTPWSRMRDAGYSVGYGAENIAGDYPDVLAVMRAWVNHGPHFKNIVNPNVTEIGVAVAEANGRRAWAVDMASPGHSFSAGPEPAVEPSVSTDGKASSVSMPAVVGARRHRSGFHGINPFAGGVLAFLGHIIWLVITPLVAFKKYRSMWLLEGVALAFFCGVFGCLVEWLLLADRSQGRDRPWSELLGSGANA